MTNPFFSHQTAALPWRALAGALVLALLAGCGAVKPVMAVLAPVPPSHSVDGADQTLALVVRERAQAEAAFAASEQLCYAKFFVNNCLDAARDKRRVALSALRAVEIEAKQFKRQATVDERDRALAAAEQDFQAQQAKMAADAPPAPPAPRAAADAAPKPKPKTKLNQREADNVAKPQSR